MKRTQRHRGLLAVAARRRVPGGRPAGDSGAMLRAEAGSSGADSHRCDMNGPQFIARVRKWGAEPESGGTLRGLRRRWFARNAVCRRSQDDRQGAGENASRAVFAGDLNVTTSLVSQWERGEKRPRGASLKLLTLVGDGPAADVHAVRVWSLYGRRARSWCLSSWTSATCPRRGASPPRSRTPSGRSARGAGSDGVEGAHARGHQSERVRAVDSEGPAIVGERRPGDAAHAAAESAWSEAPGTAGSVSKHDRFFDKLERRAPKKRCRRCRRKFTPPAGYTSLICPPCRRTGTVG